MVTINNWAISLNPNEYSEPSRFNPERFLDADVYNPLKGHFGYGAGIRLGCIRSDIVGRRVCAGYKVAHNTMFIFFSRLLYCFDIEEDPVESPVSIALIP